MYFVAYPGDGVTAIIEVEKAGAGDYAYSVNGRASRELAPSTAIDLSADIAAAGTQRLDVTLLPTPGPASQLICRVTVVS